MSSSRNNKEKSKSKKKSSKRNLFGNAKKRVTKLTRAATDSVVELGSKASGAFSKPQDLYDDVPELTKEERKQAEKAYEEKAKASRREGEEMRHAREASLVERLQETLQSHSRESSSSTPPPSSPPPARPETLSTSEVSTSAAPPADAPPLPSFRAASSGALSGSGSSSASLRGSTPPPSSPPPARPATLSSSDGVSSTRNLNRVIEETAAAKSARQGHLKKLNSDIDSLKTEKQTLEGKIETLEERLQKQQAELTESEKDSSQANEQLERYQAEITGLNKNLATLKNKLARKVEETGQSQGKIRALEKQLADMQQQEKEALPLLVENQVMELVESLDDNYGKLLSPLESLDQEIKKLDQVKGQPAIDFAEALRKQYFLIKDNDASESAQTLCANTLEFIGDFNDASKNRQTVLQNYEQKCTKISGIDKLKGFAKALATVLIAAVGVIIGAAVGVGIGAVIGCLGGPGGGAAGALVGMAKGAVTGLGVGLTVGAGVTGIASGAIAGHLLFKPSQQTKLNNDVIDKARNILGN